MKSAGKPLESDGWKPRRTWLVTLIYGPRCDFRSYRTYAEAIEAAQRALCDGPWYEAIVSEKEL